MDVLSVSPAPCDHAALKRFLCPSVWRVHEAFTLSAGVALLRKERFHVLICERDLCPGSWKAMLAELVLLQRPPYLIVTSRLADDYLWAEALNLGAYDVLSKPLDSIEVLRVLDSAWLHWSLEHGAATESLKVAAGPSGTVGLPEECRHAIACKKGKVFHEDTESGERGRHGSSSRH